MEGSGPKEASIALTDTVSTAHPSGTILLGNYLFTTQKCGGDIITDVQMSGEPCVGETIPLHFQKLFSI